MFWEIPTLIQFWRQKRSLGAQRSLGHIGYGARGQITFPEA